MFRVTQANPAQKRTIQPKYAQTQATPKPGFLDPTFDREIDILPGIVMRRIAGTEQYNVATASTHAPVGLAALFCAPRLGIDEVTGTGANHFTVWTGDEQAEFEILAPAFDIEADWSVPSIKGLGFTDEGKLTPKGSANDESDTDVVAAELISVLSPDKILISLNHSHNV